MKTFDERLKELRKENPDTWDSTTKLMSDIEVYTRTSRMNYALAFDDATDEKIEKACASLVKLGASAERLYDELAKFISRREEK